METINHECYVSLEVAKLFKEAGFDWECTHYYSVNTLHEPNNGFIHIYKQYEALFYDHNRTKMPVYSAPTLDVAQKWLREVKHLDISIHYDPTIKSQPYVYFIYDVEEKFNDILGIISPITHSYSDGYFYKYEEAQEGGIKKALEIINKGE